MRFPAIGLSGTPPYREGVRKAYGEVAALDGKVLDAGGEPVASRETLTNRK
jgi:protocatechuate 3,4-dioxygenase beta subunit